ncbi:MAG: Ku protein [Longimicrobiales bacterium]|nr:Ku protein [Longimicrobiales bacterium]
MPARAIWKGILHLDGITVPVKLYSAVEDRKVRFRLLHEPDGVPLRRVTVHPETDEAVPYEEIHKGYETDDGKMVVLDDEDLEALEPEPSRDIEITRFVDPSLLDHRWYDRPYYLGPDGPSDPYFALARALGEEGKEGVARWVMRKKEYTGALRLERGYPMLITLRSAEEVLEAPELDSSPKAGLSENELAMARQLVSTLKDDFDPTEYEDEYRHRVLELVSSKARGEILELDRSRGGKEEEQSLAEALRASLEAAEKRKAS